MPPVLAVFLTLIFIFFLFWRDSRKKNGLSSALWIPLIWFFLSASRFTSQWLSMIGLHVGSTSLEDGSPIDALVFFALIASGLYVLSQRRVQLSEFRRQNVWLTVFLVYCFLAIVWSDFPIIAFKRWIKVLGHPIMALIILTEPNPLEAVRRLLKSTAYLFVPLSILLGKYFSQYGRTYNYWTGEQYFVGATTDKNALGHTCMIIGVFFFWNTLLAFQMKNRKAKREEIFLSVGFLFMTCWLLKMSSSATSLLTMTLGMLTIGVTGLPFVNRRHIATYLIVGIVAFAAADSMFGIYANVVHGLGRNLTLTDRTTIWQVVLNLQPNPILGTGFESFWLGNRLDKVWASEAGEINEAHNGYLEIYLNLGAVGVLLLVGLLIATFNKIRLELLRRFEFGQLRLGLLIAIMVYNFTEAAFVSVHFIYTIFFLIAIDYVPVRKPRSRRLPESVRKQAEGAGIPAGG
jgi:exopolysaccharide production protein ExoQ